MSANVFSMGVRLNAKIDGEGSRSLKVLAVGEPDDWQKQGKTLPRDGMAFVAFHEVTGETLDHFNPEIVFSPVLARSFDCIELAILLHNLGFKGTYNAYSLELPKPGLIEREVRQICPRLTFNIVTEPF